MIDEGRRPRQPPYASSGTAQGSVRREILDRILIMNAAYPRTVLADYATYFNERRPHRALNQASPLRGLPDPIDGDITVTRRDRLGGLVHEYSQVGWGDTIIATHRLPATRSRTLMHHCHRDRPPVG